MGSSQSECGGEGVVDESGCSPQLSSIANMKWPKHLSAVLHDPPSPLPVAFPFKPGTFGTPAAPKPLSHFLVKKFILDAADRVELQHTYLKLLEATARSDYATLQELTTQPLYERLRKDLESMRMKGYRLHLKQPWDGVMDFKIYTYTKNYGLSPFEAQNYPPPAYSVDIIYMAFYPLKYEYKLLEEPKDDIPEAVAISTSDPFSIIGLERTSPRLRKLLALFPVCVVELSAGFLSQRKFHITDLYAKSKLVGGEDEEEYEFHLFKFQKTYPADENRYNLEPAYRRFLDVNFPRERMRWAAADIDQSYGLGLLPAS